MSDEFEANEREDAACEKSDRIAQLEDELAEAKAREARLDVHALNLQRHLMVVTEGAKPCPGSAVSVAWDYLATESPPTTALRDLLGPVEKSMTELRDTCKAAMRVVVAHGAVDDFEDEITRLGIDDGVGGRAQEQLTRLRAVMGKEKE